MSPRKAERERWLVIPRWEEFQHYRDRDPVWIKLYTRLEDDPEWLELSMSERGLMVSLWVFYARSMGQASLKQIRRRYGSRHLERHLERLSRAGFIRLVASKPQALRYQVARPEAEAEKETEKELPQTPSQGEGASEDISFEVRPANGRITPARLRALGLRPRDLRKYTGCRETRGSHALKHVVDVLGTDRPPPGWPYPEPEPEAVVAALEALQEHEEPSGV